MGKHAFSVDIVIKHTLWNHVGDRYLHVQRWFFALPAQNIQPTVCHSPPDRGEHLSRVQNLYPCTVGRGSKPHPWRMCTKPQNVKPQAWRGLAPE